MNHHHPKFPKYIELADDDQIMDTSKNYKRLKVSSLKKRKQTDLMNEFDPYKFPPSLELAEMHLKATKIGCRITGEDAPRLYDPQSLLSLNNNEFKFFCDLDNLSMLGAGYPLYFYFLRVCILMLGLTLIFEGLPALILYSLGTTCDTYQGFCKESTLKYSIANKLDSYNSGGFQEWSRLILILILVVFQHWWRWFLRFKRIKYDEQILSVSDFTVVLRNLPKDFKSKDTDEILKNWIEQQDGGSYKVSQIVLCYNIDTYESLQAQYDQLMANKAAGKKVDESQISYTAQKIKTLEDEFAEGKSNAFLGVAYVSFETQEMSSRFRQRFKGKHPYLAMARMGQNSLIPSKNFEVEGLESTYVYSEEAREPPEILWANYNLSVKEKGGRHLITLGILFLALIFSFFCIAFLTAESDEFSKNSLDASSWTYYYQMVLSELISYVVIAVSYLISYLIDRLATFCKFETFTSRISFVADYNTKINFINTALVIFTVAVYMDDFYSSTGLVVTALDVIFSNAYLSPLLSFFDYNWIILRTKRWYYSRKADEEIKMLQKDLNEKVYQNLDFDMAYKIGCNTRYMATGVLYCAITPLGLVYALLGMAGLLLSIYVIRKSDDIGNEDNVGYSAPYLIGFVISFLNCFVPTHWISKYFFPMEEKVGLPDYETAKVSCDSDYDISNPAYTCMSKAKEVQDRIIADAD